MSAQSGRDIGVEIPDPIAAPVFSINEWDDAKEPLGITRLRSGETFLAGVKRIAARIDEKDLISNGCNSMLPGMKVAQDQIGIVLKNGKVKIRPPGAYRTTAFNPWKGDVAVIAIFHGAGVEFDPIKEATNRHRSFRSRDIGQTYRQIILQQQMIGVLEDNTRKHLVGNGTYVYSSETNLRGVIDLNDMTQVTVERGTEDIEASAGDGTIATSTKRHIPSGYFSTVAGITIARPEKGFIVLLRGDHNTIAMTEDICIASGKEDFVRTFVQGKLVIEFGDLNNHAKSIPILKLKSKDNIDALCHVRIAWRQFRPDLWVTNRGAFTDPFDILEEKCTNMMREWLLSVTYLEALQEKSRGFTKVEFEWKSDLNEKVREYGVVVSEIQMTNLRFPHIGKQNEQMALQMAEAILLIETSRNDAKKELEMSRRNQATHIRQQEDRDREAEAQDRLQEVQRRKYAAETERVTKKALAQIEVVNAELKMELAKENKDKNAVIAKAYAEAEMDRILAIGKHDAAKIEADADIAVTKKKHNAQIEFLQRQAVLLKQNPGLIELLTIENKYIERLLQKGFVEEAIEKAEDNIQKLQSLYWETGIRWYKPNIHTYNVSNTVSQDLKQNENNEEEEEDDEEDKKRESFVPEGDLSVACDAVLNVWAKRGTSEAAERCEAILERMEYLRRKSTLQVQPTTFSFATVMKAWANAKDVNGTERAERTEYILQQLLAAYQDKNKNDMDLVIISPDTVVFNSVIDAWAKSGDPRSGAKGEALFKQMLDLSSNKNKGRGNKTILSCRPDIITYNSLINCWSNSGHMNAAKESERILKGMEEQLKALTMKKNNDTTTSKKTNKNDNGDGDGDDDEIVAPNRRTYNSVLKAYAKSRLPGAPKRAFAILNYMLQAGRKEIQPDVISFTTVLDVWAKSKEENKAAQAQAILQKMNQFYMQTGDVSLRPNAVTYNAVLNACAFSAMTSDEERKQALKVALSTFQEMQQSSSASNTKTKGNEDAIRADSITYGTLLKCIANLIPSGNPSRTKMSCNLFEKCCTEGLVGEMAWNEFRRSVSRKTLAEVLSQNNKMDIRNRSVANIQVKDLPKDWTCNVFEAKTYRSNRHHDRKGSVDKKGGRRGIRLKRKNHLQVPRMRLRNSSAPCEQ